MSQPEYKSFPNELYLLQFFGQYLPELDVSASARMSPFVFYYGGQHHVKKGLEDMLQFFEDRAGLGINVKASAQRGPYFIIFFNGEIPTPPSKTTVKTEVKQEDSIIGGITTGEVVKDEDEMDIEATLLEAKALYNDADKRASKAALEAFGTKLGITLNKGKTFDGMIEELAAELAK